MRPSSVAPCRLANAAALAAIVWIQGCLSPTDVDDLVQLSTDVSALQLAPGDSVRVDVTVTNVSDRVIEVADAPCRPSFVVVRIVGGRPVAVGPMLREECQLPLQQIELAPGAAHTFTSYWNGSGFGGRLAPGRYGLLGRVDATFGVVRGDPVLVRIVG